MNDHVFQDSLNAIIPSFELKHEDQKVSFAIRTMEYIYQKTQGKPDVPHRHNYYTVIWAQQACGTHYIDYREYPIESNVVFFVSPGQVHQVILKSQPHGMAILFTREFLEKYGIRVEFIDYLGLFSDHPDMPPFKVNDDTANQLDLISNEMLNAFQSHHPLKYEAIGAWLKLFLIECNKWVDKPIASNTQSYQSGKQLVRRFKQLVESRFATWHKVTDYANELSISSDYLNIVLKSNIGVNAKEFINDRIIIESKRLAVHTDNSLKEIAFKIGFNDPSHFSKFFKNVTGESFSDFRDSLIKSIET